MSKTKTVSERLLHKAVRLEDGLDAIVCEVLDGDLKVVLDREGEHTELRVEDIEARGGKFFQKEGTKLKRRKGMATVIEEAVIESNEAISTEEAVSVIDAANAGISEHTPEVEEVETGSLPGSDVEEEQEVVTENHSLLVCQFCSHEYPGFLGYIKPDSKADVCPGCLDLAEARLRAAGVTAEELTEDRVVEFLSRFYGFVNSKLEIVISGTCKTNTEDVNSCEQPVNVEEENPSVDVNEARAFIFARKAIAEIMVSTINRVTGSDIAELHKETAESVTIRFNPFDFELTSLCEGYVLNLDPDTNMLVREEGAISLDEIFAYFCADTDDEVAIEPSEAEDADADLDLDEDFEDDEGDEEDEIPTLPLDSFYRLQDCKNPDNNKKLVKILDVILPEDVDGQVVYRVIDRNGKTYKVSEPKLRVSAKSF